MRRLLRRVAIGYLALLALLWLGISRWASLGRVASSPTVDEVAGVLGAARALVEKRPIAPPHPSGVWSGVLALWCHGVEESRVVVRAGGGSVAGLDALATPDVAGLAPDALAACRLKLDVIVERAPLLASTPLAPLSLVPGLDGMGVTLDGGAREELVTPDELLVADLESAGPLAPGLEAELGIELRGAITRLASRAGLDAAAWRRTPHALFRFRSDEWVEPATRPGAPVAIRRGHLRDEPEPTPQAMREAAIAGGQYLVRHLHEDGRFDYEYYPVSGEVPPPSAGYSLPRHAGAVYFLARLYQATRDPAYADAARSALDTLVASHPDGCDRPDLACVGDPNLDGVDLGSAAMSLLGALEYHRATGDARFDAWAVRLANFLVAMQKSDGDFCHLYRPSDGVRDEKTEMLYFSGEAAYALAKLAAATPDPRYRDAVTRALHYLTVESYATFVGGFYYGEDHWTCLAVDASWDLVEDSPERERWGDFCEGFAAFLDRSQFHAGDGPTREQPDLVGSYSFTPFFPPHATPVGSRSEALDATLHLARRRGHDRVAARIAEQISAGMRFLLGRQLRADRAYLARDPAAADGAFLLSDVKPVVRIDFIQHAGAALLEASRLLAAEAPRD